MNNRRLTKTCERIVALQPTFKLDMASFIEMPNLEESSMNICNAPHPCGTTYCIAGILAHNDKYPESYSYEDGNSFDYNTYIYEMLISDDMNTCDSVYVDWLFDAQWPDSLEHAKYRAQYLLDNDLEINNHDFYDYMYLPLDEFKLKWESFHE